MNQLPRPHARRLSAAAAQPLPTPRSRRLTILLALGLLCGAGAAFALASLAPTPERDLLRQVVESVRPLGLANVVMSADRPGFRLFRTDRVDAGDSPESLLKRLGVSDPSAVAFMLRDAAARSMLLSKPGRVISAEADSAGKLLRLTARWVEAEQDRLFRRLVIERRGERWTAVVETAPLQVVTRLASANIRTTLLDAAEEAQVPDSVSIQIVDIFDDIDFHADLRAGDRFRVVYETLVGDGEALASGRVLSVDFSAGGQTRQAIWFQPPGRDALTGQAFPGAYFTPSGRSLRRAYLASPLEFSKVTSGFSMREHPISKSWRAHLGVDYAAPSGTPVRSVGDGVVEFTGVQGGYGNVVIVEHRNGHSTLYAHLSRIAVQPGQPVEQGQRIGNVGATGWATGPHLHFEFRVDGVHHDPQTLAQQTDTVPLTAAATAVFLKVGALMRMQLAAAEIVQHASAE